jgi:Mrp family chromosome partitioning ATPase
VTGPLVSDRSDYLGGSIWRTTLRARRADTSHSGALRFARLLRAAQRQAWIILLVALVVTGGGVAYEVSGGVPALDALRVWAGVGGFAGLLVGATRELGRNTITSIARLGRHRGFAILGAAPELTRQALRQLPPNARNPMGALVQQPGSAFASAFRDLQDAIAGDHVVAFIAPRFDEGATTSALCVAISAMQQGRRVILLDCDIRRRSLTRALDRTPSVGVLEAAGSPESWRSFVDHEDETGLPFIPAAPESNPWRTLFGAPGFPALLDELRREYELIVLDCPPALGSADGMMLARMADRCVVVAAWDETPLSAVRSAMRALRTRSRLTTGIYVNRVPANFRFGRLRPD